MLRRLKLLGRVVACSSLLLTAAHGANVSEFLDFSFSSPGGPVSLPGRLFVPPEAVADPHTKRPLIVFLHGGGAAGTNNVTQVEHTPDYLLDEAKRRGAFLYVPQTATTWASISAVDSVMTMINRVVDDQNADPDRLYATGYSNGGGGTWNLLSRNPDRFAAALTVSAVAPATGFNAANLLGTAVIAVHARDDATVPVARSRTVVNGILAAAGESVPGYPIRSNQSFLVSNPSFAFHRDMAASAPPDSTLHFFIDRPDLDLMYFEPLQGGHTGLLGIYYSPPIYDWMFSHGAPVPEPHAWVIAGGGLFTILIASKRRRLPC
jgi:predicted esterase